jgi:hypothetical protein
MKDCLLFPFCWPHETLSSRQHRFAKEQGWMEAVYFHRHHIGSQTRGGGCASWSRINHDSPITLAMNQMLPPGSSDYTDNIPLRPFGDNIHTHALGPVPSPLLQRLHKLMVPVLHLLVMESRCVIVEPK